MQVQEKQEEEMEGVTFQPRISEGSAMMVRSPEERLEAKATTMVRNRDARIAAAHRLQLEERRRDELAECTFQPVTLDYHPKGHQM